MNRSTSPVAAFAPTLRARAGPIDSGSSITVAPAAAASAADWSRPPSTTMISSWAGGVQAASREIQSRKASPPSWTGVMTETRIKAAQHSVPPDAAQGRAVQDISRAMTEDGGGAGPGLKPLALALTTLTLALSLFRFLDADELEHVHSTWHVPRGAWRYVDFFQHHHSLLWYVLAPLLAIAGSQPARSWCSGSASSC